METLLQQLLNGLVVGSVYALVALGYHGHGILGLINFAHGEVLMVGALTALTVISTLMGIAPDTPPLLLGVGLLAAMVVCMIVAFLMERLAYRKLRNAPRLAPLITAIGVSFLLQTLAMIVWGRNYHTFPQLISTTPMQPIEGVFINPIQITTIVASAVIMVGLVLLVTRTKLGRAMRATAENHRVASLMGVDVNKIIALTFVLGAALAPRWPGCCSPATTASPTMRWVSCLASRPSPRRCWAASATSAGDARGIVLGLVEAVGAGYIEHLTFGFLNSSYQDIFAFVILGIVLIFRPTGLLGERVSDRA